MFTRFACLFFIVHFEVRSTNIFHFLRLDVNSSMVQWIQDKSDQDWHSLDEHIHLVTSKENGHNIGLIYVVDDYSQIESKISP